MRFAKDRLTGKIVDASKASRSFFSCPKCDGRVSLRAGTEREPHFAHLPGEGTDDCEDYHPGLFGGTSRATARHGVQDTPDSFGLAVGLAVALNGLSWNLLLRLPEVPTEELGYSSLGELSGARVNVFCGGSLVGNIAALDLRPGVGIARVEVPPMLQEYRCEAAGRWPSNVTQGRWAATAAGLSASGTLFRLRAGEWSRLRDSALVEWGEPLLLIAEDRCPPPQQVSAEAANGMSTSGLLWRLWRITLPEVPHADVAAWLDRLGHEPRSPIWRIRFLSIPVAFTDTGSQYEAGVPLVVELVPPTTNASASVSIALGTDKYTSPVSASKNCPVHGEVNSEVPAAGMIEVIDEGLASASFEFVFPELQEVGDAPRLRVRIGSEEWEPWGASAALKADRNGDVELSLGVEGARLDLIAWLRGTRRRVLTSAARSEVTRTLTDLLSEAELIEIDAGNLGRVRIPIGSMSGVDREAQKPSRLTGWINAVATAVDSGVSSDSIPIVRGRGGHRRIVSRVPLWINFFDRVRERKLR